MNKRILEVLNKDTNKMNDKELQNHRANLIDMKNQASIINKVSLFKKINAVVSLVFSVGIFYGLTMSVLTYIAKANSVMPYIGLALGSLVPIVFTASLLTKANYDTAKLKNLCNKKLESISNVKDFSKLAEFNTTKNIKTNTTISRETNACINLENCNENSREQ